MPRRTMRTILISLVAVAWTAGCGSSDSSTAPAPADLGRPGPYAAGFTSLRLIDTSRAGDGTTSVFRPVPVFVWYPVDPGTVGPDTPEAAYPLDPFRDQLPVAPSSLWEKHGADPAWQAPRPSTRGPFPLVVFAAGYGTPAYNVGLGTRLATHGFVVVAMNHYGDFSTFPWYPPPRSFRRALYDRPRDASFVLTEVLARNASPGHLLRGVVDPDRVAAVGFSLGGYASMALAAGDDDACDLAPNPMTAGMGEPGPDDICLPTLPDPRFRAIVPIDGSSQVLRIHELRRVTVPVMGIGEEWDSIERDDPGTASWHARAHALFTGPPALRVDVRDTNHSGSFGEGCLVVPVWKDAMPAMDATGDLTAMEEELCASTAARPLTPWPEVRDIVGKYVAAFLKTHLSGEDGYQHILTPEYALASDTIVELFTRERVPASDITEEWPPDSTYFRHQSDVR